MRTPLPELIAPDWAEALAPVADRISAMGDFLRAELAAGRDYLPAGPNVLRAFTRPLADVKVLIVGQDPYRTRGHPVGLSFSVAPDVRPLPRSLVNIYAELQSDLGIPPAASGDLTPWFAQGVLLLNPTLTVEVGRAGAHLDCGWQVLTSQIVQHLSGRERPPAFLLWGKPANGFFDAACPTAPGVPVFSTRHPSHDIRREFMVDGSHFQATADRIDWWALTGAP